MRLTGSNLPCGAELVVRFRTARHHAFIQTRARVVYTLPDLGSGVEFTDINPEDLQQILRSIHGNKANRRKMPRVPLATQIHIQDTMGLAYSRDLSVGGIFIDTKETAKLGTRVDLRFNLNDDGPAVIASGEVRYVVPKMGMGVQFTDVSADDRKRIENFVESSPDVLPEALIEEGTP